MKIDPRSILSGKSFLLDLCSAVFWLASAAVAPYVGWRMIADGHQHPRGMVLVTVVCVIGALLVGVDSLREMRKITPNRESQKEPDDAEIEFIELTSARVVSSVLAVPLYSLWLLFLLTFIAAIFSLLIFGGTVPMVTEGIDNFSDEPLIFLYFIVVGPALATALMYAGWVFCLQILASLVIAADNRARAD